MDDYLEAVEVEQPSEIIEVVEVEQERDGEGKFTGKRLTKKRKQFVKEYVDPANKKATLATITEKAGYSGSKQTLSQIGGELLKKPEIIMALGQHADLFESAIVGTVRDWQDSPTPRKREIALDAAKFGHDKIFGKATTKIEQQTSIVQIAINLTGDGEQPPTDMLDLTTV